MRNGNSQVMSAKAHISVDTIDTGDNYCETTTVTSKHDFNNRSVSHTQCFALGFSRLFF